MSAEVKIGDRVRYRHGFGHGVATVVRIVPGKWVELKNDAGHKLFRREALVTAVATEQGNWRVL